MKKLRPTTQFKKDYKKYRHFPDKVAALKVVLEMLQNEVELPEKYYAHPLHGKYKGCIECHIESDYLLIWIDQESDIIDLIRLGSHSELFKNK